MKQKSIEALTAVAKLLSTALLIAWGFSMTASYHWFFDLFSHFVFQYAVGGFIFAGYFVFARNKLFLFLTLTIALLSCAEITLLKYNAAAIEKEKPAFVTIVQYNRRYDLNDHSTLEKWIRQNKDSFNIVVIQEARTLHVQTAQKLKNLYPYQIHEPRPNAFGMVIISKYPFISTQKILLKRYALNNFALHALIELPDNKKISLYAVHPPPPTNALLFQQRRNDMLTVARAIAQDTNENKVMVGDWNITPYSPFFKETAKTAGLQYGYNNLWMTPTWPSIFVLPLFKIPIDHMLFSPSLAITKRTVVEALGSDHHPVIASFAGK